MDPTDNFDTSNLELEEFNLKEVALSDGKAIQKLGNAMELLTRVDLDLAYSYEKLGNLHILFTHALAWESDIEAVDTTSKESTSEDLEKALVFDLLSCILDSEVKEIDDFTYSLQEEIDNARKDIFSSTHLCEVFNIMEEKFHDTEKTWKQSQEQVLDMKMLSAKLERSTFSCGEKNSINNTEIDLFIKNNQVSATNANSKLQNIEQQRYILRMAERSLARELDLEKKFLELRESEVDLKLKLHHTERVAFHMEEAAEVAWGRTLEAENAAEVFMGTSKDLLSRLHLSQFNLNSSTQRESAVKSELQNCQQLKLIDSEKRIAEESELLSLRNKVKLLEEQLKVSKERLKNENSFKETSQEKLSTMESIIESLHETIHEGELRVENAEAKVTELTETNLELSEELNFLKGSDNSKGEMMSLLEKKSRESELQLLHAKASSEASQEQQNMLYSAIWDMETLIEDLKSKVSKAESKTEQAEEQCLALLKVNNDLNKELNFMQVRMEDLEASLHHVNDEKEASAVDINIRSKLIMDLVMKLAIERERIQNELFILTKQNKVLMEKLRSNKIKGAVFSYRKGDVDDSEILCSEQESANTNIFKAGEGVVE